MAKPSGCTAEVCRQAKKLCKLGATNVDLADYFGVGVSTVDKWVAGIPEFKRALREGKMEADAKVAQSLYHRAIGYKHIAFKIMQHEGRAFTKRYVEHFPPDTTAAIFWLKNRRPDLWRDVNRFEHTGKNGGPIETTEKSIIDDARAVAFALAAGRSAVEQAKATGNAAGKVQEKSA